MRLSGLLLALLLAACAPAASPGPGTPSPRSDPADEAARLTTRLADEYWRELISTSPVFALFSGVPDTPQDRLDDNSLAAVRRWQAKEDRWLRELRRVDAAALEGRPEMVTYGVLLETLESSRQTRVCHAELWPLDQQGGTQITLPVISTLQPLGTAADRASALARWHAMPRYLDVEIAKLREGLRRGYSVPRGNAATVLEQLDAMLALPPAQSPFAGLVARDSAPGFGEAVRAIVADEIVPAVRRYREFLAVEYLPRARPTTAISALPDGTACYRARMRSYTTLDLDPRAVHELGLAEMRKIDSAMREIAGRSFGTTDVPALLERMRGDPRYMFQSREEVIATAEAAVARARAAMPRWFGRLPAAGFIVDPCQPYEEKAGCPGSYVSGTPDGRRPGRYRINAGDPTSLPRGWAEATAFHEGIPGHHLQFSLGQERPEAHPITRYLAFSGFSEGWALYAELLADEMGLYSSDLARFGEMGEQGLRAARLVVDTGLHLFGWTREQAIDYMLDHMTESRANIESEVDRYIATPGQATAYMVGRLEIQRLRRLAEERLGPRFDIRVFHDRVLENGSIPLPLLRRQIESWLASGGDPDSAAGP